MTTAFQFLERIPTNPNADSKMIVMLHDFDPTKKISSLLHRISIMGIMFSRSMLHSSSIGVEKAWYELDFFESRETYLWFLGSKILISIYPRFYRIDESGIFHFLQKISTYLDSVKGLLCRTMSFQNLLSLLDELLDSVENYSKKSKAPNHKKNHTKTKEFLYDMENRTMWFLWMQRKRSGNGLQAYKPTKALQYATYHLDEEMNDVVDWLYK